MKLKMLSITARDKMNAHAQSRPAGQDRARCYEIAAGMLKCGKNGVAYYVANLHRTETSIEHAINLCVDAGIAEEKNGEVEFFDGSRWCSDGCTPAYS